MKNQFKAFWQYRSTFFINIIIVIGSVMSYGLIAQLTIGLDRDTALSMVFMVIPMTLMVSLTTKLAIESLERKIQPLLDAMTEVSGGNLKVRINTKRQNEYTTVYHQFNHMVVELDNTKREMEEFVNNFSHEFKTPITSIKGFAELMKELDTELSSDEKTEYLDIIVKESSRLVDLSEKLLLLSKVDGMQIVVNTEEFSVAEQLRHCLILLERQLATKNLQWDLDLDDMHYIGNAELLEQIWLNLLTNAINHSPDGAKILVSGKMLDDGSLQVAVRDEGSGMDDKTVEKIFQRRYQRDYHLKGNGLGLSIVKRIIDLCQGEITVNSTLGQGTCFTVTLPNITNKH
ncbi:HAMP domain-containing sensor histidine kinase [Streptococcus sp. S784/96/1]|uniref:HAMP domain-containing sensor histidine kinase n=1 Tax=Streptococcus sp. S784/96/1 TaxID=2653499 RepID=UPI001387328C|nr:HAMP domain-containing sensor histidine kinase [Streptococcus sp. S784/96/1]